MGDHGDRPRLRIAGSCARTGLPLPRHHLPGAPTPDVPLTRTRIPPAAPRLPPPGHGTSGAAPAPGQRCPSQTRPHGLPHPPGTRLPRGSAHGDLTTPSMDTPRAPHTPGLVLPACPQPPGPLSPAPPAAPAAPSRRTGTPPAPPHPASRRTPPSRHVTPGPAPSARRGGARRALRGRGFPCPRPAGEAGVGTGAGDGASGRGPGPRPGPLRGVEQGSAEAERLQEGEEAPLAGTGPRRPSAAPARLGRPARSVPRGRRAGLHPSPRCRGHQALLVLHLQGHETRSVAVGWGNSVASPGRSHAPRHGCGAQCNVASPW